MLEITYILRQKKSHSRSVKFTQGGMESWDPFPPPPNVSIHESVKFTQGGMEYGITAYAKSQKTYEVVCRGDEKWGSGSPFFPKTRVISTRLTYKNVKSIAGSKGLSPLAGCGAAPHKNRKNPSKKAMQKTRQKKSYSILRGYGKKSMLFAKNDALSQGRRWRE